METNLGSSQEAYEPEALYSVVEKKGKKNSITGKKKDKHFFKMLAHALYSK